MLRDLLRPEPGLPGTVLLADGLIPTVELYRQILDRVEVPGPLAVQTGAEVYLARQRAARLNLQCLHVLVRTADAAAHAFVQRMRCVGLPYAYVLDDNFWLLEQEGVEMHDYYRHPLVRRTLQAAVAGAEVVLCHSEHFAHFLRPLNPRVAVVPAAFSFELLDGLPPAAPHDEIRVGVVANSSRAADLAMLLPAIEAVLATRPQVVFEFIGWTPPALRGRPGVRSFEGTADYRAFLALKVSRGWLLGLAPLLPNRFVEYKSNNKYREFGGCGIAALYSDSRVYRECVREGDTGWLVADDPQAWVAALLRAIDDPEGTRAAGQRAREDVLAHHRLDHVAARWQQALAPVVQRLAAQQGRLRWARLKTSVQERWPGASMLLIAPGGPRSRLLPREFEGLERRHVLFDLQPGERLVADIPAPLPGPFRWSGMVATFRAALTGTLEVHYEDEEGTFHAESLDMATLPDGATVPFRCPVRRAGRLRLHLTSRASGRLALHALGRLGSTTFPDTGYRCPLVFAV
jgi:glycosyltransferase involved in cell wall biosynthesis